jgi:hypothetical protein
MSLAQHVTQTQGFDYEGPANPNYEGPTHPSVSPSFGTQNTIAPGEEYVSFPDRSEWRRLSFAPVDIVQKLPNLAAYKVSNLKRYGEYKHLNDVNSDCLTACSPSSDWDNSVLVCSRHCIRLCSN